MATTVTIQSTRDIEKTVNDAIAKKLDFIYERMDKQNRKIIDLEKMIEGLIARWRK